AATGVVLGAAYMLMLYRRVVFGPPVHHDALEMPDLTWKEKINFVPLAALVLVLGIFPGLVMDKTAASVDKLIAQYQAGLQAGLVTALSQEQTENNEAADDDSAQEP